MLNSCDMGEFVHTNFQSTKDITKQPSGYYGLYQVYINNHYNYYFST